MHAIILGLIDAAILLLGKITALKAIAKQNQELTPEQEQALDARMQKAFAAAHWQVSTPPGA